MDNNNLCTQCASCRYGARVAHLNECGANIPTRHLDGYAAVHGYNGSRAGDATRAMVRAQLGTDATPTEIDRHVRRATAAAAQLFSACTLWHPVSRDRKEWSVNATWREEAGNE